MVHPEPTPEAKAKLGEALRLFLGEGGPPDFVLLFAREDDAHAAIIANCPIEKARALARSFERHLEKTEPLDEVALERITERGRILMLLMAARRALEGDGSPIEFAIKARRDLTKEEEVLVKEGSIGTLAGLMEAIEDGMHSDFQIEVVQAGQRH